MQAREIMTSNPVVLVPSDSIRRAAELMREVSVGALPVVENVATRVLVGIITDRDIAIRCTAEGHSPTCQVGEHMTRMPLETVTPDVSVDVVIEKMERAQVRRIPVVDAGNVLVGMISQADLAIKVGPSSPEKIEELLERISAAPVGAA
jgi:CBS domain-containing protein